ncbi:MAG: S9 family peptidase [Fermentimonas sp.]|jgi:oligopeptidase B
MKVNKLVAMCLIGLLSMSCNTKKEDVKISRESDFVTAPVAAVRPDTFVNFGKERIDNYFWMKDKNNQEVINYLNAENAYTDTVMSSTKELQAKIYDEMLGRINEDDETYPSFRNGYWYYSRTEKGKQYRTYCRRKGTMDAEEEVLFDLNKMAEGLPAFIFGGFYVSPDSKKVAYLFNETGSYAEFVLKFKDLKSGKEIGFTVVGASSVAWANDNETLFYSVIDETLRPYRVERRKLNDFEATTVYEEKDVKFRVGVSDSKLREFIYIISYSTTTTEERLLSADNPEGEFKVFMPRVQDVDYLVSYNGENFIVRYKDRDNLNGKIYIVPRATYEDKSSWKEFVPHRENVRIEGFDQIKDYLVIQLRKNGLDEIVVKRIVDGKEITLDFPEPVYTASFSGNPEFDVTSFRYSYSSLNRPTTLYEYDIATGDTKVLKEQVIPSGFNPDDYVVERLWAKSHDGVDVPMAIVYKKGLKKDGSNPALLYSYGSYGVSSDVYFSSSMYSLIDRGFVFGIAQIRGGSDLGEQWYEDGKLLKKKNTFLDFIACSEKLISDGYTSADKLAAMGGSAGGLLMGAVTNMRPDLYQTIVAQVPFVDIINTMLDDTLPLTTGEYEEWGNPNEEEYYNYMYSYSPYDNIEAKDYPNMLVTGGLNDSQVLFHEPTKYTAKLRALKTDDNILILKMNMDSGHGGATGRYEGLKDRAFELAFILNRVGIDK